MAVYYGHPFAVVPVPLGCMGMVVDRRPDGVPAIALVNIALLQVMYCLGYHWITCRRGLRVYGFKAHSLAERAPLKFFYNLESYCCGHGRGVGQEEVRLEAAAETAVGVLICLQGILYGIYYLGRVAAAEVKVEAGQVDRGAFGCNISAGTSRSVRPGRLRAGLR